MKGTIVKALEIKNPELTFSPGFFIEIN